tara:strand:+ start:1132 stop:1623 length:492 start_codon:yes stop_codon:yes gene_type:complete
MATNEMGPGPLKKARRFIKKITQGTILEDQKKPPGEKNNPFAKIGGSTKATYKTGGMVNANANLKATATAGSKGVKAGVNPKAAASNVAKKPSKPRSKAPKKALPKAAYGMSVKGYNMGGGTGDGTQVPYGTRTLDEITITAPKRKGKPKAKLGMSMKGKKSC